MRNDLNNYNKEYFINGKSHYENNAIYTNNFYRRYNHYYMVGDEIYCYVQQVVWDGSYVWRSCYYQENPQ